MLTPQLTPGQLAVASIATNIEARSRKLCQLASKVATYPTSHNLAVLQGAAAGMIALLEEIRQQKAFGEEQQQDKEQTNVTR